MKISNILFLLLSIHFVGFGQFERKSIITECKVIHPEEIMIANLNGDNLEDFLVVSNQQKKVFGFKNNGKNDFIATEIDLQIRGFDHVSAINLNTDGLTDLLVDSYSEKALFSFLNKGNGHFEKNIIMKYDDQNKFISEIKSGDLDQDGDIDIIISIHNDEELIVYKNEGNGFFDEKKIDIKNKGAYSIQLTDLDSDGDIDILSNNLTSEKVILFLNDGKGNFSKEITIPIQHEFIESMSIGDVNQDGLIDIFITLGSYLYWHQNLGNGKFSASKLISNNSFRSKSIKVADLDNDGFLDLLPTQYLPCLDIIWFKNTGDHNFEKQIIEFDYAGDTFAFVESIDLNNDNHIDLIFTSKFKNKISGLLNNGSGIFKEKIIIKSEITAIQTIKTGDLDGDKIPDLITGSSGDYKITWYKNKGKGDFLSQKIITTTAKRVYKIIVADLNHDTYLDIIALTTNSFEEDKISWYENDGKGNFSKAKTISSTVDFPNVFIHDLNLDGNLDIVSAASGYNYYPIELYRNDGQDSFSKQIIIDSF